jgi:nucleoside phosphorylase
MKALLYFFCGTWWLCCVVSNSWAAGNCKALVVVGMEDERAAAAGDDAIVVVGTANAARLRERLSKVDTSHIKAVFSFGVAGGLDPTLVPGDLLLSSQVLEQNTASDGARVVQSWPGDPTMLVTATLKAAQSGHTIALRRGIFLGTDLEARDNPQTGEKDLHQLTGADIIDNESHIAAQFASEHKLPFLSVRAVSDSANHPLPPAALLPLDPVTGGPDSKAIMKSLLENPSQIPALIRTAWEYHQAISVLKQFRNDVGFGALASSYGCLNGK